MVLCLKKHLQTLGRGSYQYECTPFLSLRSLPIHYSPVTLAAQGEPNSEKFWEDLDRVFNIEQIQSNWEWRLPQYLPCPSLARPSWLSWSTSLSLLWSPIHRRVELPEVHEGGCLEMKTKSLLESMIAISLRSSDSNTSLRLFSLMTIVPLTPLPISPYHVH